MESNTKKLNELEQKIDNLTEIITQGFEVANDKIEAIESKIDTLKGGSEKTIGNIEHEVKKGFAEVITELKKINSVTRYEDIHENSRKIGEA